MRDGSGREINPVDLDNYITGHWGEDQFIDDYYDWPREPRSGQESLANRQSLEETENPIFFCSCGHRMMDHEERSWRDNGQWEHFLYPCQVPECECEEAEYKD